jgi:hypothetical protein
MMQVNPFETLGTLPAVPDLVPQQQPTLDELPRVDGGLDTVGTLPLAEGVATVEGE